MDWNDPGTSRLRGGLADNRTRMEVVAARHPQSLGQDAEMDAVNLLSIDDGVHGSMYVKQQAVFSSIPSQGRVGRESTGDVVMHYDGHAKHLRGLGSVQHALARPGSGIQVVTLDLTCLGLGTPPGRSSSRTSPALA